MPVACSSSAGAGAEEGECRDLASLRLLSKTNDPNDRLQPQEKDGVHHHCLLTQAAEATAAGESGPRPSPSLSCSAYTVLALYHFQPLEDPLEVRQEVVQFLREHSVLGGILVATEGINGTICYPTTTTRLRAAVPSTLVTTEPASDDAGSNDPGGASAVSDVAGCADDSVQAYVRRRFPGVRTRVSYSAEPVFFRLRVRCKDEIVTMGVPELIPLVVGAGAASSDDDRSGEEASPPTTPWHTSAVGQYVPPLQWNELISDPDTWLIDARNEYEVQVGTFVGADNPRTTSFTEWPSWLRSQWEHKKQQQQQKLETTLPRRIAMFCTGGIRCEKATAYCHRLVQGSGIPVYHLEGGILAYLDEVPPEQSLFEGECYVFDRRVAVTHGLRPTERYTSCHACRHPLSPLELPHPAFEPGVACPHCANDPDKQSRRERYEARERQMQVARDRGIVHLGSGASGPKALRRHSSPPRNRSVALEEPVQS